MDRGCFLNARTGRPCYPLSKPASLARLGRGTFRICGNDVALSAAPVKRIPILPLVRSSDPSLISARSADPVIPARETCLSLLREERPLWGGGRGKLLSPNHADAYGEVSVTPLMYRHVSCDDAASRSSRQSRVFARVSVSDSVTRLAKMIASVTDTCDGFLDIFRGIRYKEGAGDPHLPETKGENSRLPEKEPEAKPQVILEDARTHHVRITRHFYFPSFLPLLPPYYIHS